MNRFVIVLALVACKTKDSDKTAAPPAPTAATKRVLDGIELPVVASGYEPVVIEEPIVVVSTLGVAVNDRAIVQIDKGSVDCAEKEGGCSGVKIVRLTNYLAAIVQATKMPPSTLQVALDKRATYRTLIEVMFSAKQKEAGFKRFQLLAKSGDRLVQAPFVLPDKEGAVPKSATLEVQEPPAEQAPGADLRRQIDRAKHADAVVKVKPRDDAHAERRRAPPPAETPAPASGESPDASNDVPAGEAKPPVQLVVSMSRTEVLVWSISGLEGTLKAPTLHVPLDGAPDAVRAKLAEIVNRRWYGKPREDMSIILMCEGVTPMQRVAEMIGAIRTTADGKPLFPDIMLSSGFE